MSGLVAAGCVVVAIPLLVALFLAGTALDRLTSRAESLVEDGLMAARVGAYLREGLTDLERNARQYVALGDPDLLEVFFARVWELEHSLQQVEHLGLSAPFPERILRARRGLAEAVRIWVSGLEDERALRTAVERIQALHSDALAILAAARTATDAQVTELRAAATTARRITLVSALTLVPLTALLAFAFSRIVTRPLRSMGLGITALGHARYGSRISIGYPAEMRRLGAQLDWLRRRLARLEEDKDRFLRHISHELKTPLASLFEGARLLRQETLGPLTPAQREIAQILGESATELAGQIENLLAYGEWREGRRRGFEAAWFDTRPLFEDVLAVQKLPLAKRSLQTELRVNVPCLFGQRSGLRVALDNLLTNAIKHAPEGSTIEMHASLSGEDFEISVRDRGRGVPETAKARIFEPFVRGSETEESGIRGTGVGLSIVKETILAHRGIVEVEDAHPGARFRMAWPCPRTGFGSDGAPAGERLQRVAASF